MSNAEKLGLDSLPWLLDDAMEWMLSGPWHIFFVVVFLTIGLGELSKLFIELPFMGIPFIRPRFYGYIIGDVLLGGAGLAALATLEKQESRLSYFNKYWFWAFVAGGCALTIFQSISEQRAHNKDPRTGYAWQQQVCNPSKLMHSLIFGPVLAILGSVVIPALVGWRSCSHCLLVVVVLLTAYGALNFFIDPRRDGFKLVVWAHPHRAKFEAVIRAGYEIPSL